MSGIKEQHSHQHVPHSHTHSHTDMSIKNLQVAFFLNLVFSIIEIVGGLLTHSMAILSDALHDAGDAITIGFSWYLEGYSHKKRDEKFSYGYSRFALISAFISSIVLFTGSVFILAHTIPRLFHPQPVNAPGMVGLAVLGIVVNGIAVLRLHKGKSANEKVVRLHLLEDVLGWAAILAGSILMLFFNAPVLDPILSVFISCFILYNVFKNFKQIVRVFLQGIPSGIDLHELSLKVAEIPGVESVHDVHLWSMDGLYNVLTAHIVVSDDMESKDVVKIKERVRLLLRDLHIQHETLEIGYESEECEFKDC